MEGKLMEAAQVGDTDALYACIRQHPDVFKRIDEAEFVDTPLHIAAARGHTEFAVAIMYLRPSYARKLNQDAFSPIHLALQNEHTKMVRQFLAFDKDLVRVKGKEGYTALHYVAENGNIDLLAQFLHDCPTSIEDLTIRNETALHIAAKTNKLQALKILARWLRRSHLHGKEPRKHLLNSKDGDGNTVLHIAASNTQPEMIKILLECKVDIEEMNANGLTALNILDRQEMSDNREFSLHMLHRRLIYPWGSRRINKPLHERLGSRITAFELLQMQFTAEIKNMSADKINALLVVLALILTATYQALINPPGGVRQGDPSSNSTSANLVGTSIMDPSTFNLFFALNLIVFLVTIALTISLVNVISSSNTLLLLVELLLALLTLCMLVALNVTSPGDQAKPQPKLFPLYFFILIMLFELSRKLRFGIYRFRSPATKFF